MANSNQLNEVISSSLLRSPMYFSLFLNMKSAKYRWYFYLYRKCYKCQLINHFFQKGMLDCLLKSLLTLSFILSEPDGAWSTELMESLFSLGASPGPAAPWLLWGSLLLASSSAMTVRTEHSNSGYFWLTVSRTPVRAGNTNPLRIVSKEKILVIRFSGQC